MAGLWVAQLESLWELQLLELQLWALPLELQLELQLWALPLELQLEPSSAQQSSALPSEQPLSAFQLE